MITTYSCGPFTGGVYRDGGRVRYFLDNGAACGGRVLIHDISEEELRQLMSLAERLLLAEPCDVVTDEARCDCRGRPTRSV